MEKIKSKLDQSNELIKQQEIKMAELTKKALKKESHLLKLSQELSVGTKFPRIFQKKNNMGLKMIPITK